MLIVTMSQLFRFAGGTVARCCIRLDTLGHKVSKWYRMEAGNLSYRVHIESFEGPFDLLLELVSRQKVDVAAISLSEVIDQYLATIEAMRDLDLDVASDFLLVASTLLEIKSAALLPVGETRNDGEEEDDEFEGMSSDDARDILVARLIAYKQFKNIAGMLGARMESEARMHPRHAGIETAFLDLMPDYLASVTLQGLSVICADLLARRDSFILEAEHIAAMPLSVELHAESVHRLISNKLHMTFDELVGDDATPEVVVVTFLAILELYKRNVVTFNQIETFGTLNVDWKDPAEESVSVVDEIDEETGVLSVSVPVESAMGRGQGLSGEQISDLVPESMSEVGDAIARRLSSAPPLDDVTSDGHLSTPCETSLLTGDPFSDASIDSDEEVSSKPRRSWRDRYFRPKSDATEDKES